ncbi:MAG: TolC family protein [Verrucomicrobiales bacterium]|nr:TolC family protein [Verrucomicrobiales bacterium]
MTQVRISNPDARSAAIRIDKARAGLAVARAQLWPKIFAETGYAATDNPVNAFMMQLNQRQFGFGSDFNDPDTTDNWGSEVRLEYLFYSGGARSAAIDGANLSIEASEHENLATLAQLELEVARAWFQIYQSGEIVKASLALLNNQKSNLQLARNRVDAATALQTAVLDLETKVAEAEANLSYASNSKLITVAFLKSLLGLEDSTSFVLTAKLSPIKEPSQKGLMRHELLALEKRKLQSETGIDLAKAERMPTVSGFASGRHDEGFIRRGAGDSWMVGVMVRLKVWGGGETKAKIHSAQKDVELAQEAYRKQKLAIQLQVKTAKLNLNTARKRITLANKGIQSAEKSLQLTRQRFKEGLALSTQLIDSETALANSRVRLAKSQAQEQLALASLRSALGLPIR